MQNDNEKCTTDNEECTALSLGKHASSSNSSLAAVQLTKGALQICALPLNSAQQHFTELVDKQNKIQMELATEKFRFDNMDIGKLQDMMNIVKEYQEKLLKIKQKMQNIYQRTKLLRRRADNLKAPVYKDSLQVC